MGCVKGPLTERITFLEGLGCKQTTCTHFEQVCILYSSVFNRNVRLHHYVFTGAIIGDGDRKRAPFLVLGLAP